MTPYVILAPDPDTGQLNYSSHSSALGQGYRELDYIAQEERLQSGELLHFLEFDSFWLLQDGTWLWLDPSMETSFEIHGEPWGPLMANRIRQAAVSGLHHHFTLRRHGRQAVTP